MEKNMLSAWSALQALSVIREIAGFGEHCRRCPAADVQGLGWLTLPQKLTNELSVTAQRCVMIDEGGQFGALPYQANARHV